MVLFKKKTPLDYILYTAIIIGGIIIFVIKYQAKEGHEVSLLTNNRYHLRRRLMITIKQGYYVKGFSL